jgi:hypothetical protein
MWEEQTNGHEPPRRVGHFFVLPTLWCHTVHVSITEQTAAKSYLFTGKYIAYVLSTWTFGNLKSRNFTNITRTAYMIYTNKGMLYGYLSCDVISCVCPLIDNHGSRPMKALEFLTLLYKKYMLHVAKFESTIYKICSEIRLDKASYWIQ